MRITRSRILTSFGLALIMLVIALAPLGLPPPTSVDAGHDDPNTSHLLRGDDAKAGRIVRNVILGDGIPVCSDDYPKSAKFAAMRWNTFFGRTMAGKQVFQLKPDGSVYGTEEPECANMRRHSSLGIGSVVVRQAEHKVYCLVTVGGCIHLTTTGIPPNEAWDTFAGQPVIYVWKHYDEVENPLTMEVSTVLTRLSDGEGPVTRTIAHELGHVFGLGDYSALSCDGTPSIMAQLPYEDGTGAECVSTIPTNQDKEDFRASYVPEPPTIRGDLSGSPRANTARVGWDAIRVHVENQFEIQRKDAAGGWETVSTANALPLVSEPVQLTSALATGQTPGLQTYRVVAKTAAPLQDGDVSASGPVTIPVRAPAPPTVLCTEIGSPGILCTLSPPTTLSVSNVTDTSATLKWTNVAAATGYKVRLDRTANTTRAPSDPVNRRHTFTDLMARTPHLLEVASSVSTGESNFAGLRMLVPPGLLGSVRGVNSITISWTGVSLATAYDVRLGTDDETIKKAAGGSAARAHQFTGLQPSTSYTLYVRASNAQGPSAWAETIVVTKSRPSPPPRPLPPVDPPPPRTETVDPGTETRWVSDPSIPFCILWEEQRSKWKVRTWPRKWVWSPLSFAWVAVDVGTYSDSQTMYSAWTRTGNHRVGCRARAQEDGARGAAAESVTLAAGDYTLPWGLQRISFTVPKKADVQLSLRTLDSGVEAVVLRSPAGAELVLSPAALAGGAQPSPSVTDTTLSSIAATLSLTEVALVAPPAPPGPEECAFVTAAETGATAVDLAGSPCATVPAGTLEVTLSARTLSLTLPTGYDWLLLRLSDDPAVLALIDTASGAYLALNAATGAEEARGIKQDVADTVGPIFDAIVTSASSS